MCARLDGSRFAEERSAAEYDPNDRHKNDRVNNESFCPPSRLRFQKEGSDDERQENAFVGDQQGGCEQVTEKKTAGNIEMKRAEQNGGGNDSCHLMHQNLARGFERRKNQEQSPKESRSR